VLRSDCDGMGVGSQAYVLRDAQRRLRQQALVYGWSVSSSISRREGEQIHGDEITPNSLALVASPTENGLRRRA
jgi:hypothetical protein